MMNEKTFLRLKEIYHDVFFEALIPLRLDYSTLVDSFEGYFTNNVSVRFTYENHTICRSLEELSHAAHLPFKPIYYSTSEISEEKREELKASVLFHAHQLCKHRELDEPWCMEICSQLLKLVASN